MPLRLPRALSALAFTLIAAATLLFSQQAYASTGCTAVNNGSLTTAAGSSSATYPGAFSAGDVISIVSSTANAELTSGGLASGTVLVGPLAANTPGSYVIPSTSSAYILNTKLSTNGNSPTAITATCVSAPIFTVTTAIDDPVNGISGTAANCTAGSTTDASCSLRDAITAVTAATNVSSTVPGIIQFSPTTFPTTNTAAQNTINLLPTAQLNLVSNMTINGLTTGTGGTLTNLITVKGIASSPIFVNSSGSNVKLNNLNITGGSTGLTTSAGSNTTINQCNIYGNSGPYNGAGINIPKGSATITNSAIYNNSQTGSGQGGGIATSGSTGTVTMINDTVSGNSTTGTGSGGGIYVGGGTLNLTNVTVSNNSSAVSGGGIYTIGGTTNLVNTIVSGNSATVAFADVAGTYTSTSGNVIGSSATGTSNGTARLAALANYGGPTQSMVEFPSSTSICAGSPQGRTTDQRGFAPAVNYPAATGCVDAGADQATYSLVYTTQPASSYGQNQNFSLTTSPVVSFQDNGYTIPYTDATNTVAFADSYNALSGTTTPPLTSGTATLSAARITSLETSDLLLATYKPVLNSAGQVTYIALSNNFAVVTPVVGFAISTLNGGTAGAAQGATLSALSSTNPNVIATNFTGNVTVTSTDTAATIKGTTIGTGYTLSFAGSNGTITLPATTAGGLVFKTAGSQTITLTYGSGTGAISTTSNAVTITTGPAASVSAATGSNQTAKIGAAFTLPLQVQVLDSSSNSVGGIVVTFTPPTTGASATLSSTTCTTSTSANATTANPIGTCSVTATANGTASTTAYTVSAAAAGVATPASFTLTNTAYTPSLTLTTSPAASSGSVYGQPVTLTSTPTTVPQGGSYPTGNVTFKDGTTTLTTTAAPGATTGVATYTVPAPVAVGPHSYSAVTAADNNFTSATATAVPYTVSKATPALAFTGPSNIVVTPNSTTTTIPISITPPYTGVGVSTPSSTISYYFTASGSLTQIGAGTVNATSGTTAYNITVPSVVSSTPGAYTLYMTYGGDTNFAAVTTPVAYPFTVGTPSYTVSASPNALTITRGSTGSSVITFTPTANYAGTATLACSGLPANTACVFTPNPVMMTGNNAVVTSTLTVYTLAPHAVVATSSILWIPGILFAAILFLRRRSLTGTTRALLMLLVLAAVALGVNGCGSGFSGTPTGPNTVLVTSTAVATTGSNSSNLNKTATITITIQ